MYRGETPYAGVLALRV
uniref:Uncharacterized protein n=1 Tax=Arundo donax TaxID=35708 RepID=A0A0A9BXM8_ARUDO